LDRLSPSVKLDRLKNDLTRLSEALSKNTINQFDFKKQKLEGLTSKLKRPDEKIKGYQEKQLNLLLRLEKSIQMVAQRKNYQFDILKTALQALNPLNMMDKGFAVVSKHDHVITSIKEIEVTDQLSIRFKDGIIGAKVTEKKEN
jgi:exodeoxyribonuclease VII large subunit